MKRRETCNGPHCLEDCPNSDALELALHNPFRESQRWFFCCRRCLDQWIRENSARAEPALDTRAGRLKKMRDRHAA